MFNGNGRNESGECYAALRINDTIAMSGEQTAATDESLFDMPVLYIGGFPKYLLHQLDLPTTGGIIGCMRSLQVDLGCRRRESSAVHLRKSSRRIVLANV